MFCIVFLWFIKKTLDDVDSVMGEFPVEYRARTLEANIFQSIFAKHLFKEFGDKSQFGKYCPLQLMNKQFLIFFPIF